MSDSPAVRVEGLTHRYGERVALDSVEFEVKRQGIFGFLGPNGGGKTTLFSILSTLLPIQRGCASALGFDVDRQSREYREQIGVAFQSPSLDRRLTVLENLAHQGELYGLTGRRLREVADTLLQRFDLTDRKTDIVDTLSGGLKRRVELAKCLMHRPALLLLDEPSTGLDPGARHDLWANLERLRADDGVTVVLTTHLMEEAERCDELALLDLGRIVAHGSPLELRSTVPGECLTIVAERPEELGPRITAELELDVQRIGESLRIQQADGEQLFEGLMQRYGEEIRSLSLGRPTLEDVFMVRTGRRFAEDLSA